MINQVIIMSAELVSNCPRCGARKITFDVLSRYRRGIAYRWKSFYEVFSVCRHCDRPTVFLVSQKGVENDPFGLKEIPVDGSLNDYYEVEGFVSLKDFQAAQSPEHVPDDIKAVFDEGATCLAVQCFNAAGTMFRLVIDMAPRGLLPAQDRDGLNAHIRRNLGPRIAWLLDHGGLPEALRDLSTCIREDGNDGAHAGTLGKTEAEDLLDFTTVLLERLYTEPERLRLAQRRRDARRKAAQPKTLGNQVSDASV